MNSSKCIALFAAGNLFNIGGLQRSYSLLTKHLARAGHKVILVGWKDGGSSRDALAYPIDERVEVLFVPQARTTKNLRHIVQLLSGFPLDVILIVNSGYQALFLSLIALELDIPYVVSLRGSMEYCLRYLWPSRFAMELLFQAADAAHVLMPSYKAFFPQQLQRKVTVIPSQIEPASTQAQTTRADPLGRFYIIYSGRLSFEKRVNLLIDAFTRISHQHSEWYVLIVGNGPLKEDLLAKVKENGMHDRIHFREAKNTEEMYSIYPQAHIKVLPSEQEGCPMALREAMAHGLPVIAFNECSGANEIITDGLDGLLISADPDRITSLSNALVRLMANPSLRTALGSAAINTAAQYVPDPINQAWEYLLVSACKPRQGQLTSMESGDEAKADARRLLRQFVSAERYSPPYRFEMDDDLLEEHLFGYVLVYGRKLFQTKFYLDTYFDVKRSGVDPLLHYLSVGCRLGYNPSQYFDTKRYREQYMSALNEEIDPLLHFYLLGRFEGAKPIPVDSSDIGHAVYKIAVKSDDEVTLSMKVDMRSICF
jgi:glycosyltransferase involved in cell wall biosynthesis